MRDLLAKIGSAFTMDESDSRQFSIEVDPRTVSESDIRTLTELGFNRLSLGIQDFDPIVQEAVNRMQSYEEVSNLVSAARAASFKSISFDLIYGLPHQNVAVGARCTNLGRQHEPFLGCVDPGGVVDCA